MAKMPKTKEKEIYTTVSTMYKENKIVTHQSTEKELVEVVRLDPEAAYVTISTDKKATIGLPNYSSASVSVFLSVPSPLDPDQMNQAFAFAANFCEEKIREEIAKIESK